MSGETGMFEQWPAGSVGLASVGDDVDESRRHIVAADLVGAEQERTRQEMLDFTRNHADCLHRSCGPGHLTGSAVVVNPDTGQTLLIHHAKLDRWLQPGGHADGEGNLGAVAWTEAGEETGLRELVLVTPAIDADIHLIGARAGEPAHRHLDLRFLVLAGQDRRAEPNHETLGARWVDPGDPLLEHSGELARLVHRAVMVARSLVG